MWWTMWVSSYLRRPMTPAAARESVPARLRGVPGNPETVTERPFDNVSVSSFASNPESPKPAEPFSGSPLRTPIQIVSGRAVVGNPSAVSTSVRGSTTRFPGY